MALAQLYFMFYHFFPLAHSFIRFYAARFSPKSKKLLSPYFSFLFFCRSHIAPNTLHFRVSYCHEAESELSTYNSRKSALVGATCAVCGIYSCYGTCSIIDNSSCGLCVYMDTDRCHYLLNIACRK